MRRFTRFLRIVLLPVAVLAIVAGSSASASAETLSTAPSITVTAAVRLPIQPFSMNW